MTWGNRSQGNGYVLLENKGYLVITLGNSGRTVKNFFFLKQALEYIDFPTWRNNPFHIPSLNQPSPERTSLKSVISLLLLLLLLLLLFPLLSTKTTIIRKNAGSRWILMPGHNSNKRQRVDEPQGCIWTFCHMNRLTSRDKFDREKQSINPKVCKKWLP